MEMDFTDKAIMVTGAGHGLGRAIAHAFVARGAIVWACDINETGLEQTEREAIGDCRGRTMNITELSAIDKVVGEITEEKSRVDILVNCAGGVGGQIAQPLEDVTPAQWQALFDINVTGAFNCIQAVVPEMKAAKAGNIINISSGAGLTTSLTGIQAYASAKAALIGLTRQLAQELGPHNINVNSVAPGFIRSNPSTEKQWEAYGDKGQKALVESITLKRLGSSDDIAHAVLFFASDYANWITGQTLSVAGS